MEFRFQKIKALQLSKIKRTHKMNEALKEYAEGMKPALYIATKYNVCVMWLHREYAKLCANAKA